ncbi:MAG: hypothetical protein IT449_18230 [Phycisphaerales bacterium]|nr:hypothetical protein [Phycisphaerales bacterium]
MRRAGGGAFLTGIIAGIAAIAGIAGSSVAARADVIHVRAGAAEGGNGRSWDRAFGRLQDALAAAHAGDELWITAGAYLPAAPGADRDHRFTIPDGVALYGGFAGVETDLEERDPALNPTILSGDLNGDDGGGNFADNAYHVVEASGVGQATVLDGLVITGGNADGPYPGYFGGGLLTYFGRPNLIDCTFTRNRALYGGGLFGDGAGPRMIECTFTENEAIMGGGAMLAVGGTAELRQCRFADNLAELGAGLVVADRTSAAVLQCDFTGNQASFLGGGMHVESASPAVVGCLFHENVCPRGAGLSLARSESEVVSSVIRRNPAFGEGDSGYGGGVYVSGGFPRLINCTIADNESSRGGGLFAQLADVALVNCILWGNTDSSGGGREAQIQTLLTEITADYCCIQGYDGLPEGAGNFGSDPLMDSRGRLSPGSPCIDAADTTALPFDEFDLDGDGDPTETSSLDAAAHVRRLDDAATADGGRGAAPIVDIGALELHCTGSESVKASCRPVEGGNEIKATAKHGQPGASVTLWLDGADARVRTFGATGKVKAKWQIPSGGVHEVSIESACGRTRADQTDCG